MSPRKNNTVLVFGENGPVHGKVVSVTRGYAKIRTGKRVRNVPLMFLHKSNDANFAIYLSEIRGPING